MTFSDFPLLSVDKMLNRNMFLALQKYRRTSSRHRCW